MYSGFSYILPAPCTINYGEQAGLRVNVGKSKLMRRNLAGGLLESAHRQRWRRRCELVASKVKQGLGQIQQHATEKCRPASGGTPDLAGGVDTCLCLLARGRQWVERLYSASSTMANMPVPSSQRRQVGADAATHRPRGHPRRWSTFAIWDALGNQRLNIYL